MQLLNKILSKNKKVGNNLSSTGKNTVTRTSLSHFSCQLLFPPRFSSAAVRKKRNFLIDRTNPKDAHFNFCNPCKLQLKKIKETECEIVSKVNIRTEKLRHKLVFRMYFRVVVWPLAAAAWHGNPRINVLQWNTLDEKHHHPSRIGISRWTGCCQGSTFSLLTRDSFDGIPTHWWKMSGCDVCVACNADPEEAAALNITFFCICFCHLGNENRALSSIFMTKELTLS